jgi:hypothetical protein
MTPLIFKSLEMRNFLTVGNQLQSVDFENQGTVNVIGENLDNGGSNGAGKCIYGDTKINVRINGVKQTMSIRDLYLLAKQ